MKWGMEVLHEDELRYSSQVMWNGREKQVYGEFL